MLQNPQAVLFDLDGVLIDTEPQYTAFWRGQGADFFPSDALFAASIKGSTLTQIFERHFAQPLRSASLPERGLMTVEEVRALVRERLSRFEASMTFPYVPKVFQWAEQLHAQGVKTAIVTSSDAEKMRVLLSHHPALPSLFTRIFTAEDALRSKPAPDCYLQAAQSLGVDIRQCVVVEDSEAGLQAARASGAYVVGVVHTEPSMTSTKPSLRADEILYV